MASLRPLRLLLLSTAAAGLLAAGAGAAAEPLTRIEQVRALPLEPGSSLPPVRIKGIVTWRGNRGEFAIQDDTGGTWVQVFPARNRQIWKLDNKVLDRITEGVELEIEGFGGLGGYSPVIWPSTINILGPKPLPAAAPADPRRFFNGIDSGQRIEMRGVVLGFQPMDEPKDGSWKLRIDADPGIFFAIVPRQALPDPNAVLDARIRVKGVASSGFNTRGELLNVRVLVSSAEDLIAETQPTAAASVPLTPLQRLMSFHPQPVAPHRVRVQGTVTCALPGNIYYIQESDRAVRVESRSSFSPAEGDRVEVIGYVDLTRQIGTLGGAEVRKLGAGTVPPPIEISPPEVLKINSAATASGQPAQPHDFDGHLIRFEAELLGIQSSHDGKPPIRRLTLKHGESIFTAAFYQGDTHLLDMLQPGSTLAVKGIVQLEYAIIEGTRSFVRPVGVNLLLRNETDISVLKTPSWWTPRRLLALIAAVGLMLGAALLWAWQLRRQVRRKTHELAAAMRARRDAAVEFQASLRERNRLAANLHDTLLQTMSGIGFQLEACNVEALPTATGKLGPHLELARKMLDHGIDELRGSVWALRSLPMHGLALPEVLRSMADRAAAGKDVHVEVRTEGDLSGVPDFVAGSLLLAAQEALHNALKHGHPKNVTLEARPDTRPGWISVSVRDDGVGFAPGSQAGPAQGHFGLAGMRERMEHLEGEIRITSTPGTGTEVRLAVPLRAYDKDVA